MMKLAFAKTKKSVCSDTPLSQTQTKLTGE